MENTVVIELKKEDAQRLMFLLSTALQDAEVAEEKGYTYHAGYIYSDDGKITKDTSWRKAMSVRDTGKKSFFGQPIKSLETWGDNSNQKLYYVWPDCSYMEASEYDEVTDGYRGTDFDCVLCNNEELIDVYLCGGDVE